MNVLTVSGNLGKDAVVRKAGDQSVAGFSLAMKSGYGDKAQTIWLDCSLWGKQAESGLVQYLKKGQFVVLSGELGTREHEGKTYLTLRVANVTLGGKSDAQPTQQQQQPQQQYNQAPQQQRTAPPAGYQNQMPQGGQNHAPYDFEADIPF
jgi:single-strand DNA-binding protein